MPAAQRPLSRPRKGFNLIEAAIVLGVVGLVIGGIWVAASAINDKRIANKTSTDLLTIALNIQNLISNSTATAMGNANLSSWTAVPGPLNSAIFPSDWMHISGYAFTPYGQRGDWISNYAGTPPYFRIHLGNVPKKYCAQLVGNIINTKTPSLREIAIYRNTTPNFIPNNANPSVVTSTCDIADDPVNIIYFEFNYTRAN